MGENAIKSTKMFAITLREIKPIIKMLVGSQRIMKPLKGFNMSDRIQNIYIFIRKVEGHSYGA